MKLRDILTNLTIVVAKDAAKTRVFVNGDAEDLSALHTTNKGNLVEAINELSAGSNGQILTQDTPAGTWIFTHSVGRKPNALVYDEHGDSIYPDVHASDTNITLIFAKPASGSVVLT